MSAHIESSTGQGMIADSDGIVVRDVVKDTDLIAQFDEEDEEQDVTIEEPSEAEIEEAAILEKKIADSILTVQDPSINLPVEEDEPETLEPLDLYLREISRKKLLTDAEKTFHMDRYFKGKRLSARIARKNPQPEITEQIKHTLAEGWESRSELIQGHLAYVVKIAKRYRFRGVAFLDLINAGNIGLIRALNKFDPKKEHALSTYATAWISSAVLKEISDSSRTMRLNEHKEDELQKLVNIRSRFLLDHEREPTDKELSDALFGVSDKKHISIIRVLLRQLEQLIPLETMVGDENSAELHDFVYDFEAQSVDEEAEKNTQTALFTEVFSALSVDERLALQLQFSLPDNKPLSIRLIAKKMNISQGDVKGLLLRAKRKIKAHPKAELLHDFIR